MNRRPATLRAIAQQLNVHVSTVSRVLNGTLDHAGRAASKETIERIRTLAASLDYQPNTHARTLKTRHSHEIAVLVPRLSDIVLATIYEGIDEAASASRYTAFVANTLDRPERQRERAERALARNVEGLIISDVHCTAQPGFLEELEERQVPFVLVSRRRGEHCSVTSDDEMGGRLVAEHLFAQGHTRVAVIAGEPHSSNARERTTSFVEYYRERGVAIAAERVIPGHFDTEAGFSIAERLLTHPQPPTAIFAVNDFLAIGLFGAMRNRGLVAGRDIAVVGYNDTPLAAHLQLTSISTHMHAQGVRAVAMLLKRIAGEPVQSYRFPALLKVRASSLCRP
ncbi:LacI family DNA-binding transcriptional regulator [Pseudomonas typographi]|uniref:Substrate-binding domain-containing protein n=1 Tax=Pseudomonas typographi TaxID=2715964 RepID=A0ABR7Z315_9PSED|nr:LacI family DNA-binding transcriptional regulator [Pseudomonas typographi]MBD1550207.1 substrate-binding domain-containing protein [Pseudomonas typographi]MBD1599891.1 substrate-binding domain-containing protein [Pseudomonas typographi]